MHGFLFALVCTHAHKISIHFMTPQRTFRQTLSAVAWSFIGLRRRRDFDVDAQGSLNPAYVIAGALIGVLAFIAALLLAAHWAVG